MHTEDSAVSYTKGYYRDEPVIFIRFTYDIELIKKVKKDIRRPLESKP